MTPEQAFLAGVAASWGGYLVTFGIGKWVNQQESSTELPIYRIKALEDRMDRAGERMSDLADEVQALPDKLRAEFVTQRECELMVHRRHEAP